MASTLVLRQQAAAIAKEIKKAKKPTLYISLNRSASSVESQLKKHMRTTNVYYVDCVGEEESSKVVCVPHDRLDMILSAVRAFAKSKKPTLTVVDTLGTIREDHPENDSARFIHRLTSMHEKFNADLVAFSSKQGHQDILADVMPFFTEVKK